MKAPARCQQVPCLLCQHQQLPWVLERSFKPELGMDLLADRDVLGVPAGEIPADYLEAMAKDLAMPTNLTPC